MNDIFTTDLNTKIDAVYPDASRRLDRIDELPDPAGKRIVHTLLEEACQSQHLGKILAARTAMRTLPRAWLARVLQDAIEEVVDLKDEWEYRRLMELLKDLQSDLYHSYIAFGIAAGSGEIYEVATDLSSR
jgi:hypothetical protein